MSMISRMPGIAWIILYWTYRRPEVTISDIDAFSRLKRAAETEPPPSNEEGGPSLAHNTGPSVSHTLHTEPLGRGMLEETHSATRIDEGYRSSRPEESRPTSNGVQRSLEVGAEPGTTVA